MHIYHQTIYNSSFPVMTSGPPNGVNLAKFAFNIYGALNLTPSDGIASSTSSVSSNRSKLHGYKLDRLTYNFDREVTTLANLNFPLAGNNFDLESANHLVVGGRNCLRILALSDDQTRIVQDVNVFDQQSVYTNSRILSTNKLNNINTIKSHHDTIACGLSNGSISIYRVAPNGKSKLMNKYSDHKRCINSLDFVGVNSIHDPPQQLISGSQDGSIKLWDLRSATPKPVLTVQTNSHFDPVRSCQYSPHASVRNKVTILSAHDSGTLCKFDLRSGMNVPERKWNLHTGPALSLHIHPLKEFVLTGGRDQKMCVWNYSDSSPNRVTPEHMINTYGPVMKVRWCTYENNAEKFSDSVDHFLTDYDKLSYEEREGLYSNRNGDLFNYDFACLYLNDDSSISVYNLSRKYIPKEIISTGTKKPFQNFIWGKNSVNSRRLWTIAKSNVFTAYGLDETFTDNEVSKPLDELPKVAVAWDSGMGNLCFVNQDKYEFELGDNESISSEPEFDTDDALEEDSRSIDQISSMYDKKAIIGSVPIASKPGIFNPLSNSLTSSPIEKPQLHRSFTSSGAFMKSPSPGARGLDLHGSLQRPKINRNPSQTTQDSNLSTNSPQLSSYFSKKSVQVTHASPYIVPISLPIPQNDDGVFETLCNNYLLAIPDGFKLIDVCLLNASVAAGASRFRDCQVWRMLAVSLEDDESYEDEYVADPVQEFENQDEDLKSILSDLGNFVGSYNSNSTLTTNYGQGNSIKDKSSESVNIKKKPESKSAPNFLDKNDKNNIDKGSNTNLMDMINLVRGNSLTNLTSISPNPSRSNSTLKNRKYMNEVNENLNSLKNKKYLNEENENAVVDDDADPERELHEKFRRGSSKKSSSIRENSPLVSVGSMLDGRNSPIRMRSPIETRKELKNSPTQLSVYGKLGNRKPSIGSFHTRIGGFPVAEDLDNENLNILNNAALNSGSISSSAMTSLPGGSPNYFTHHHSSTITHGSFTRRNSIQAHGFHGMHRPRVSPNEKSERFDLGKLQEQPEGSLNHKSELTKVMTDNANSAKVLMKPWKTQYLLKQALEYASSQGDIILHATISILFYEYLKDTSPVRSVVECVGLYVDILRRKRYFVQAASVISMAPADLINELKTLSTKEVDLRFFCCWCQKLLVNEKSKLKQNKEDFGYWYCDECSSKQLNCIYCNEPCKGLTVVISLKCGHRGHFGCLKEWFIAEENSECPGGCDYDILGKA